MKRLFTLLLLLTSAASYGQRERYADSLLLDAQYDQVIHWADQLEFTSGDANLRTIVMTRKAEAFVRLGRYDEADRLLTSLTADGGNAIAQSAIDIAYGSLYLNQGLYTKAERHLESALDLLQAAGQQNNFESSQALSCLGNLRRATGEYTRGEELLTRSLAIREGLFNRESEWIAAAYNDLGLIYGQTDPDKALTYYERALRIYEKLHVHKHPKIAIALTNIGFAYAAIELYGDATANFESALKIWEGIYTKAHPTKAFLNLSLGEIYRKLKNFEVATAYYEKARTMYERSYGQKHPDLAAAYNALGNVQLERGHHEAALAAYQQALVSNVEAFNDLDIGHSPNMNGYYNGRTLLYTMLFKAQVLEARYFAQTIRMNDLAAARDALVSCDTLVTSLRQQISNESDKLLLGSIAAQVYQSGVRICVAGAEVAFQKKEWLKRAFYFAEKGKSAVLLEGISDAHAKAFARIPPPLLEEERQLRADLAMATTQLAQKPNAEDERRIRERLFKTGRHYELFVARLEKDFPQYYNLKYNTTAPSVDEIQQRLDNKTAIISYLIDDEHKGLYTFVITRSKYKVSHRALPEDLDRNVAGLRNGLQFNTTAVYQRAARTLSETLIPEIPKGIHDLVIIPTGRLGVIPFETLFNKAAKKTADPAYLINDFNIRYEFAASLILQKPARSSAQKAILLCAPVTFPEHDLADLPGTKAEVKAVADLFSGYHFESTLLTDAAAGESDFRMQPLKRYQFLHLAMHGVVNETQPELSRLYLKRGANDDGLLYSGDIYNLELDADLVTLSACQTGLGKISKGEGVIGLSRALAYAGARSMVVSFWRVADESTSLMMQDFYRMLLADNGANPGHHLRAAKLNMIRSGKYASPYFWAPFVLIGF